MGQVDVQVGFVFKPFSIDGIQPGDQLDQPRHHVVGTDVEKHFPGNPETGGEQLDDQHGGAGMGGEEALEFLLVNNENTRFSAGLGKDFPGPDMGHFSEAEQLARKAEPQDHFAPAV